MTFNFNSRDELINVYNQLFSDESSSASKQYACDVMTVWKVG